MMGPEFDNEHSCETFIKTLPPEADCKYSTTKIFKLGNLLYDLTFAICLFIAIALLITGKPIEAACGLYVMRIVVNVVFGSNDGD